MNRRTLLALLLAPLLTGAATAQPQALTPQDRADLARIEAYLDTLHTLKAHFLQVSANGETAEGTAWLDRPGRMRFEYDPPSPFLLVAAHGTVVFQDRRLRQISDYPLSATPLGILLADHVKLAGDVTVTGIARQPGQIQVTMVRTSSPGDGSLTLVFADNPLASAVGGGGCPAAGNSGFPVQRRTGRQIRRGPVRSAESGGAQPAIAVVAVAAAPHRD